MGRVLLGVGALVAALVGVELWSVTRSNTPAAAPRVVCQSLACAELSAALDPEGRVVVAWPAIAGDPKYSLVSALAGAHAATPSDAEAIAGLRPTLVVVAPYSRADTLKHLFSLGIETLSLPDPSTLDDLRGNIAKLAAAIGLRERGETLLADVDARVARLASSGRPPRRVVAVVAGAAPGPGTTVDLAIRLSGNTNVATLSGWVTLDQEALAALRPDVLLVGRASGETEEAMRARVLEERPVFRSLVAAGLRIVGVPGSQLGTASHHVVALAEAIAAGLGP